nr:MAG TPA: hypothetical protein [Inoviridae sp.]
MQPKGAGKKPAPFLFDSTLSRGVFICSLRIL